MAAKHVIQRGPFIFRLWEKSISVESGHGSVMYFLERAPTDYDIDIFCKILNIGAAAALNIFQTKSQSVRDLLNSQPSEINVVEGE